MTPPYNVLQGFGLPAEWDGEPVPYVMIGGGGGGKPPPYHVFRGSGCLVGRDWGPIPYIENRGEKADCPWDAAREILHSALYILYSKNGATLIGWLRW